MFITVRRHEREKQELLSASRLVEAILCHSTQGLLLLDGNGTVLPQVSRSLATLFRRQEFGGLAFEMLLAPLVSATTRAVVRAHIAGLLAGEERCRGPLLDVELRLLDSDGRSQVAHYRFDFDPIDAGIASKLWLVRVADHTQQVLALRELDELRGQTLTQTELLRGVLARGGARFGAFLRRADASMKTINRVLKKPARAANAFRNKLEETLREVRVIRLEAAAFGLSALENAAQVFEDALHELRERSALSGGDFLPLAVKLDRLYGQFAVVKSLARAVNCASPESSGEPAGVPGSLDHTLQSLTDHVAQDEHKQVRLACRGLESVPARYQAAIKNVAIALIRNAVMHGIETPAARAAAGKPAHGMLRLEFAAADRGFELSFEDDGAGLHPDQVRATAVARGIVSDEAAARMRDREAIKLIFKSRYTTLGGANGNTPHGTGMSLVRRYVHDAGGRIALASVAGHETRFKITLPPLPPDSAAAGIDSEDAKVA